MNIINGAWVDHEEIGTLAITEPWHTVSYRPPSLFGSPAGRFEEEFPAMDGPLPNEFFTAEVMGTLTGVTAATLVIVNGCQRAFNFNPAWFGLAVAETICLVWVSLSGGTGRDWLIAVINGFLVYAAAGGLTGVGASVSRSTGREKRVATAAVRRRRFLSPWWP